MKILITEDEFAIANLISMNLEQSGYECDIAADGKIAADKIEKEQYDLVLLDVMLPEIDGFELIGYINEYQIPVIYMTAKGEVKDRVKGLRLGAEDYIVKPFDLEELLVRIEVVLRRYYKECSIAQIGDITIDFVARTVKRGKEVIDLTYKEFDILVLFLRNKNIALYREMIYERVWGEYYDGETRTVELHVQRLRKKIGWEDRIKSVHKIGYRLEVEEE